MSSRAVRIVAWGLVVLAAMLLVAGAVYAASGSGFRLSSAFVFAIALTFGGVGVVIATRQPGNAIGWIFLWVAVTAGLSELAGGYADYWLGGHGGVEGVGKAAAWYASLAWIPFIVVPTTFLLLLFPDGRLLSRRWLPVAWCAGIGVTAVFVLRGLTPGPLEDYPQIVNPYGVSSSVLDPLTGLGFLLLIIGIAGSAGSLIVRFRRARGEERMQIKWLALAGAVAAVTFPVALIASSLVSSAVSNIAIMLSVLALPIAAGIAILKYRLYDIDVVINRTLVYGALTATLAAVYVGSVLVLQLVLSGATNDSSLAVAASTLAVAALFRPARSRIQSAVDRRFYRRRYDARLTLESFSARLRDQVDLAALDAELRGVVAETMQPAHVSLWLRGAGEL
jgi:hypothetical protein